MNQGKLLLNLFQYLDLVDEKRMVDKYHGPTLREMVDIISWLGLTPSNAVLISKVLLRC